jgi:hypothetical protein
MGSKFNAKKLGIWFALYHLECEHWHDVDCNGGRSAHELYVNDGLYAVGQNRFQGRDAVRMFYDWRRGREQANTRHLIANVNLVGGSERRAKTVGLITIYRLRGSAYHVKGGPRLRKVDGPVLVADFTSDCILGDDDVWRYESHILDPVFVDSDAPFSLSIDPQFILEHFHN